MGAPTDVVPEWRRVHAQNPDRALPRGVFGATGPDGEPIATPTDHRMLWHVRDQMLGAIQTPYLRDLFEFLNDYLFATCEHHWRYHEGDGVYPTHRQCLWCNSVEEPN